MPDAALTTPAQNARTRQEWAEIINADWRKSIEGIIQTGRDLCEAQTQLGGADFRKMISNDLIFSPRTAYKLTEIANHPVIGTMPSTAQLPPSWAILYELSQLSESDFADAQEHGLITADTNSRAARAISRAYKTPKDGAVGQGQNITQLPSPSDARQIARETGRMVSASDGNLYSGTTEEEDADYLSRRQQTYGVMDAIKTLADVGVSPDQWLEQSKPHWLNRFDVGDLERAVAWLEQLRTDYFQREGVVDGKVN